MRFVLLPLILMLLSACSENTDKELIKSKPCKYFAQHSRELPIVNSAIPIFENQEFDGVMELKEDSIHFIVSEDTLISELPKILVFINKNETAPYREIISQSLQSKGYWIYYACYDTLGRACFLPEFYDAEFSQITGGCITPELPSTVLINLENDSLISIEYNHTVSLKSDSISTLLSQQIVKEERKYQNNKSRYDSRNKPLKWIPNGIVKKINENFKPLKINYNSILNVISISPKIAGINEEIIHHIYDYEYRYEELQYLQNKYKMNHLSNLKLISKLNIFWNNEFAKTVSNYGITKKELQLFSKEELQQLPFQICSPLKYINWSKVNWIIPPPPPPPPLPTY